MGQGLGWDEGCLLTSYLPPRSLQHPNVLQCLGVCVETLPFLLIMEFCQLVRGWGEGMLDRVGWGKPRVLEIFGNDVIMATPV